MVLQRRKPYKTGQLSLSDMEYEKVLDACSTVEDELLIKWAVATTMRRSDVVKVMIKDINLETGEVKFFEKKKQKIHTIYIGAKLVQLVTKYLKTIPKQQKYLFEFNDKTCWNKLNRLCDIASIPRRPFHALRGTGIKRCQRAGWTLEQVCALCDDKLATVAEYYLVPSQSEMQEITTNKETI
jgi:integrase